jgi:hypothetical protein
MWSWTPRCLYCQAANAIASGAEARSWHLCLAGQGQQYPGSAFVPLSMLMFILDTCLLHYVPVHCYAIPAAAASWLLFKGSQQHMHMQGER